MAQALFKSPQMEKALGEAASIMAKAAASEPSAAMIDELQALHFAQDRAVSNSAAANTKLDLLIELMTKQNELTTAMVVKQKEAADIADRQNRVILLQNARALLKSHWRNDAVRLDNPQGGYWALARLHDKTSFEDPYRPSRSGYVDPSDALQSAADEMLQLWLKGHGKFVHRYAPKDLKLLMDVLEAVCGTRGVLKEQSPGPDEHLQLALFYE